MTSNSKGPAIVWFRQDLRLSDNPALNAACDSGAKVLPVYIHDNQSAGDWASGEASRWWLHESLTRLKTATRGNLRVMSGSAEETLAQLVREHGVTAVYWNRCYEPWRIARDKKIKTMLTDIGVEVESFNGSLLFEPMTVLKQDGQPYRVFTPFFKNACMPNRDRIRPVVHKPARVRWYANDDADDLERCALLPSPDWYTKLAPHWKPGEEGAQQRLSEFLSEPVINYRKGRDFPAQENVSRLSPHLHFGEISPHQVWDELDPVENKSKFQDGVTYFRRELVWREFSYNLLYHWPTITRDNLQQQFDRFPWRDSPEELARWQQGMTGYPIVDAGMRELWTTGYMHNRVRMIVASFLVKNLMIHWHRGEEWFWDTLVDADLANNSASWQWVAGSGADAAPYFRIFNPVTQGERFDGAGTYVRRFIPELAAVPDKFIQKPWQADDQTLADAGVVLGETYPEPMVDLKETRERALAAYQSLRE